jgi:hypothetical protein
MTDLTVNPRSVRIISGLTQISVVPRTIRTNLSAIATHQSNLLHSKEIGRPKGILKSPTTINYPTPDNSAKEWSDPTRADKGKRLLIPKPQQGYVSPNNMPSPSTHQTTRSLQTRLPITSQNLLSTTNMVQI